MDYEHEGLWIVYRLWILSLERKTVEKDAQSFPVFIVSFSFPKFFSIRVKNKALYPS